MAHFIISLPGNIPGDVRRGKVFNKQAGFTKRWPWIRIKGEEKTGYLITVNPGDNDKMKKYHFLKTTDGRWPAPAIHELDVAMMINGKWQKTEDDEITIAIKKAIDNYEDKQ